MMFILIVPYDLNTGKTVCNLEHLNCSANGMAIILILTVTCLQKLKNVTIFRRKVF